MSKNQLALLRHIPTLPARVPTQLDVNVKIRWRR